MIEISKQKCSFKLKYVLNFILCVFPFLKKIKQINAHTCILTKPFQLWANYSYFAQGIYLLDKTDKIPCTILEWSDTILELRNQVRLLTLRKAILEWYKFLLCAEHIYARSGSIDLNKLREKCR